MEAVINHHFLKLTLLILLAFLFTSCGASGQFGPTPTPLPPVVSEEKIIFPVERGRITAQRDVYAEVAPAQQDELFFRASGFIDRITVKPGDMVKAGDILAELQIDDLLNQLQQARLELEISQGSLAQAKLRHTFDVENAESDAVIAQDQVTLARLRYEQAGSSTKEAAKVELSMAEERLKTALSWVEVVKGTTDTGLEASVKRNQLAVDRLERLVSERQIIAPYDGIILDSFYSPASNVEAFLPVLMVGDPSRLLLRISFDQELAAILDETTQVTLLDKSDPDAAYPVQFLPDFLPVTNQKTGLSTSGDEIKLNYHYFSPKEALPAGLIEPGEGVKLRVVMGEKQDALLLPPAAIRGSDAFQYVIVLEDDQHRRVEIVQIGLKTTGLWEIIADLKEGDQVLGP